MAALVLTGARVMVGGFVGTNYVGTVEVAPRVVSLVDVTHMGSGGFRENRPAIRSGGLHLAGNADHASGAITATLTPDAVGSLYTYGVCPSGGAADGDPAWFSSGYVKGYTPFGGAIGEKGSFDLMAELTAASVNGVVGHTSATRASNGSNTGQAFTGPSATQRLYAALFVTGGTFTNLVVKVQSDNDSGFGSATDRITFTSTSTTGSELAYVAGDFSSETHLRVNWARSSGSATFEVYFGLANFVG